MKSTFLTWPAWAALSAVFAALTAIFGKLGVEKINSDFATFLRTVIILAVLAAIVAGTGAWQPLGSVSRRTWLFLTLSAESTNTSHPAHEFIQSRYRHVVSHGVQHLREALDDGQTVWMSDEKIDAEVRSVFATMDGLQLQWLLDPSIDLIGIFSQALSEYLERWTGRTGVLPPLDGQN